MDTFDKTSVCRGVDITGNLQSSFRSITDQVDRADTESGLAYVGLCSVKDMPKPTPGITVTTGFKRR